ncbi:MAG: GNAT family N-acetyltransferase [Oscillospiraceae bacterium]|nr:GNAT family N-acetyltransferase [Oscillospiraceae bacterium]
MNITIREYQISDIPQMQEIWNEVVDAGIAFPQTEPLCHEAAIALFAEQDFAGVAVCQEADEIVGLYILHPNNIGRCGHIANTSYAVRPSVRGRQIGKQLVCHSIEKGRELGFRLLQFNAVVKTNYGAIHLYEKLGFQSLGTIPGGFYMKDGTYEDIILFYRTL